MGIPQKWAPDLRIPRASNLSDSGTRVGESRDQGPLESCILPRALVPSCKLLEGSQYSLHKDIPSTSNFPNTEPKDTPESTTLTYSLFRNHWDPGTSTSTPYTAYLYYTSSALILGYVLRILSPIPQLKDIGLHGFCVIHGP